MPRPRPPCVDPRAVATRITLVAIFLFAAFSDLPQGTQIDVEAPSEGRGHARGVRKFTGVLIAAAAGAAPGQSTHSTRALALQPFPSRARTWASAAFGSGRTSHA
jgi:hypothetical protein